ncbi:cytochrome P450 [Irpex lacteus]|nr:cytochrome P450 [Irpex lacteus]
MSSSTLVAVLAVLGVVIVVRRRSLARRHNCSLPPGPPGWPIVGNLFDLPEEHPWLVYSRWSKKYGDIIFLRALTTPMLIVSSVDVAFDLMDKRSAIYSDRNASVLDKMTAWDFNLGLMPYGSRWRAIRRKVHENFNLVVTPRYHDKERRHIHAFLRQCIDETGPKFNSGLIRQLLAAIILDIVYGIEINDMKDEYVKTLVEALEILGESKKPGKYWVDFIPLLQYVPAWVPGAASAKFAAHSRPVVEKMLHKPFDDVKKGGSEKDCIVLNLMAKIAQQPDDMLRNVEEMHAKYATGIIYSAAAETTVSLLQSFFCAMAMNPSIQKMAREELDLVVGPERLPTHDDQASLPYVYAVLLESLRWFPVAPLGVPHRVSEDDFYNGFFIPAGTIIIPNAWHMLRNEANYPEPDSFNPGRYMKDGALDPAIRDPTTIAFGFGRRICPGKHLAKDTAFLTIASILHTFDIVPAIDEDGKDLDPTPQMVGSLVSFPEPLNYRLKPRSDVFTSLVTATASE